VARGQRSSGLSRYRGIVVAASRYAVRQMAAYPGSNGTESPLCSAPPADSLGAQHTDSCPCGLVTRQLPRGCAGQNQTGRNNEQPHIVRHKRIGTSQVCRKFRRQLGNHRSSRSHLLCRLRRTRLPLRRRHALPSQGRLSRLIGEFRPRAFALVELGPAPVGQVVAWSQDGPDGSQIHSGRP
jgi:hypothetical protein